MDQLFHFRGPWQVVWPDQVITDADNKFLWPLGRFRSNPSGPLYRRTALHNFVEVTLLFSWQQNFYEGRSFAQISDWLISVCISSTHTKRLLRRGFFKSPRGEHHSLPGLASKAGVESEPKPWGPTFHARRGVCGRALWAAGMVSKTVFKFSTILWLRFSKEDSRLYDTTDGVVPYFQGGRKEAL